MPSISAAALVRIPLTWGVINRFGRQCNRRKASCTLGDLMHAQGLHRVAWVYAPIRSYSNTSSAARGGPQPAMRTLRRTPNVLAGRTTVRVTPPSPRDAQMIAAARPAPPLFSASAGTSRLATGTLTASISGVASSRSAAADTAHTDSVWSSTRNGSPGLGATSSAHWSSRPRPHSLHTRVGLIVSPGRGWTPQWLQNRTSGAGAASGCTRASAPRPLVSLALIEVPFDVFESLRRPRPCVRAYPTGMARCRGAVCGLFLLALDQLEESPLRIRGAGGQNV